MTFREICTPGGYISVAQVRVNGLHTRICRMWGRRLSYKYIEVEVGSISGQRVVWMENIIYNVS